MVEYALYADHNTKLLRCIPDSLEAVKNALIIFLRPRLRYDLHVRIGPSCFRADHVSPDSFRILKMLDETVYREKTLFLIGVRRIDVAA